MVQSSSAKSEYRTDIDGIRSLAVLSVIIFHLNSEWLPGGFLGVDVFFVVSGYLISGIILRENHFQTFTFKNFYARRVKRIFPALFTVLILSAAVGTFLLHPTTYLNFMKSSRYASAQLANFFFASKVDYFEEGFAEQPLLHIWTLGVEEQFYLFWPLLIVLLFWLFKSKKRQDHSLNTNKIGSAPQKRRHLPFFKELDIDKKIAVVFVLLSLFSFIACYILAEANHNIAFYMFYTRAWEFCIGGFAALGVLGAPSSKKINNIISLVGLFLLCVSFFIVEKEFLNVSFLQIGVIIPCVGTVLIIISDHRTGLANRLLSMKVPVFIGRISYSLYLFHWPIIIFYRNFHIGSELSFTASLWILSVSFILATICYFLIEQPARKSKIPDRFVLISALLAITVFATGFKTLEAYDTATWRIKKYSDGKSSQYSAVPKGCVTKYKPPVKYIECKATTKQNAPYIALVGDSHTIHYLKSAVVWARESDYNVLYFSVAGCPMLLGDIRFGNNINAYHEQRCKEALPFFASEIVYNDNVDIILLAQRFDLLHNGKGYLANKDINYFFKDSSGKRIKDHTKYYSDQLAITTETIRKTGKKLMILKQVPLFPGNWDCDWEPRLKKWLSPDSLCSYNTNFIERWQRPSIDFVDEFLELHQISSFDPMLYLDKPRKKNRSLYENMDHLNGNGCHFLYPYFVSEMKKFMGQR